MDSLSDIMFLLIILDGFTDYDFDYDTVVNDLIVNIENKKQLTRAFSSR